MDQTEREYHRGEIYYADLSPAFGHEQGGNRPVLILQNDYGNIYSPTVIVTSATSRTCKKPYQPTHVMLTGLESIRTLDKRRLRECIGKLNDEQMEKIDAALRISLYLSADDFLPTEVEAP